MTDFRVQAFMCVYNEADILPWTLSHLLAQEVEVHVIDNGSTDGSDLIAQMHPAVVCFERLATEGYDWSRLLRRVEEAAAGCGADWCMLHDADEIRRVRVPGRTLRDELRSTERCGFNAAQFSVLQFWPVDDGYCGDPEKYFRYYEVPAIDGRLPHVKAWKNVGRRVDLASSGGHEARFEGRRVAPGSLVLKHYPLRTAGQARRKVLFERLPRYTAAERSMNWHVQYDQVARTQEWIRRPEDLAEFEG